MFSLSNVISMPAKLFFLVLLGCLFWRTPAQAGQVCDDQGICVECNKPFERIIPLYGALADMLVALDCDSRIVACTVADKDAFAHLPVIGTHMRPNSELVLAQKPDLVLQMAGRKEAALLTDTLRQLGLNVLTFDVGNFGQLMTVMRKLGQLTGQEQKADAIVADWKKRLAALERQHKSVKPTVYYEIRQPNLLAAGQGSMIADIIERAGGENVAKAPSRLARYNEEALLVANPDICLVQQGPMNPQPPSIAERANLKTLKCAQKGHNFVVDEMTFARPGPASIVAAEKLAGIISRLEQEK